MRFFLAILPILTVLALMIQLRWNAFRAGLAGWLVGLVVAAYWFGLTLPVFWVSQAKGMLLSAFVLAVLWPALFLYHWLDQNSGIIAVAQWLTAAIPNRGMCRILLAWALSGLLEGLAGFGLPIAVVAPMLAAMGVPPLRAVAAVAVGHAWAVTFGDMGVIFQTLVAVTGLSGAALVPWAALLLGAACLLCGWATAVILEETQQWLAVAGLAVIMASAQYGFAVIGLTPLSALGAGLSGILAYVLISRLPSFLSHSLCLSRPVCNPNPIRNPNLNLSDSRFTQGSESKSMPVVADNPEIERPSSFSPSPLRLVLATYGCLTVLMVVITIIAPVRHLAQSLAWRPQFPTVSTRGGFTTPAGSGQVFRPFTHPGTLMLIVAALGLWAQAGRCGAGRTYIRAGRATWRSASLATLGILVMVGLSTLMDHCGMSFLLAQGLSRLLGAAYPVLSPCVGILGAFATGSNNNSNVLFGSLQKNVALFLQLNPHVLVAGQTAGGSLGSMLAPAKIMVGCSTVGQVGQEGSVLRRTVPYGLVMGLVLGVLTLIFSRMS